MKVASKLEEEQNNGKDCCNQVGGMKKVCETCKWYETYTGACCNGDSDYRADYVSSMNSCENWEAADNEQYRN